MANEEHLKILRQGVEAWNAWRKRFSEDDFRAVFNDAGTTAQRTAGLVFRATLRAANLRGADLREVDVFYANFRVADLREADLREADLREADLCVADLRGADLRGADLRNADFRAAHLHGADVRGALLGFTALGFSDLLEVKGLESCGHYSPSVLGVDILQKAQGQLPAAFLKGCGLSDWEIEAAKLHNPHLSQDERTNIWYEIERLQGHQPIQINPLFISYSHANAPFVDKIGQHLDERGIRFWRDDKDLKAGRLETQIDHAIRLNPTVLLVLSEKSVESDWVEWEVEQGRKLEKELKRDVLCPVALDDAWKTCSWRGPLRRQIEDYHILDFSAWKDEGSFEGQFGKLLEGLKLFYRGEYPRRPPLQRRSRPRRAPRRRPPRWRSPARQPQ